MNAWMAGQACWSATSEAMEREEREYVSAWVASHGTLLELRAESSLFIQGSPCRELFWVERGWVKLLRTEGTGTDIIVGFRQSGALLGIDASIAQSMHPLTAKTRTAAHVWRLGLHVLDHAFEDRRVRRALLRQIGMEAVGHAANCGALGCLGASERLERLLGTCTSNGQRSGPMRVPFTRDEIAGLLGIEKSHLRRLLRSMKRQGLIETSGGWLVLTDVTRFDQQRAS